MQQNKDLWYRLGYALETARSRVPAPKDGGPRKPSPVDEASHKVLDALLTVGGGAALTRVLSLWPGRRRPGLFRLLRAGAAGAAASVLLELVRPALVGKSPDGSLEEELTDILLSGAGRGLLYASIVEPRIPGPPVVQGSAFGALEYALTPWGGLDELTGKEAPHRRIPVLSVLLRGRKEEEPFLEHLAFGIALALLYDR